MIDPAVFLGEPIEFKEICKVYPPKVKEVIANPQTQRYIMILCWCQEDIDDILNKKNIDLNKTQKPDPFTFLMGNALNNKDFSLLIEQAIRYFTHEKDVYVLPSQLCIYLGKPEDISKAKSPNDLRRITKENYFDFQNAIRAVLGFELEELDPPNLNPIVKRVRDAARKRKRLQRKANQKNNFNHTSTMCALCAMNIGITPFNIGELPYAAINELISTYQRKERYETDIQSICAGADPKKVKPKYWVRPDDDGIQVPLSGISGSKKQ